MSNSRVPGRGRLVASLRLLLRRVERFAASRTLTPAEARWAAKLADDLEATFVAALSAPGVRPGLDAVDQRRARARKTPHPARSTAKGTA